jgi:hypothetical protein
MKSDKIKALLEKYYAGETDLKEEMTLKTALKSIDDLPDELKPDAELFAAMDALSEDLPERDIDFEDKKTKIIPLVPQSKTVYSSWIVRIAAGFSLLAIGVLGGLTFGSRSAQNTDVTALQQDVNEMKELVALSQLRKESPSERIMATYEIKKMDDTNDEILDALIFTFNNDENPNVKNAAADALFKFGNHEKVRKAFINGLTDQTDPLLQIKLIDMLVDLGEKRALPKLQEVMQEENQMKAVKQKAAQGIGKLI